jgi:two-component sensor histidine kinase
MRNVCALEETHYASSSEDTAMDLDSSVRFKENDKSQDLLVGELQHRIRNLLTLVQYLINRTHSATVDGYRAVLVERVGNLAAAHELIERARGHPISMAELVAQTLKPYSGVLDDRIQANGPDIELRPQLCLALHMILYELSTNACKHGALASSSGRVEVLWDEHLDGAGRKLAVQWSERNGPEVYEPKRKGFGLSLVTKALTNAQVELSFERTGFVCRMLVEIDKFSSP